MVVLRKVDLHRSRQINPISGDKTSMFKPHGIILVVCFYLSCKSSNTCTLAHRALSSLAMHRQPHNNTFQAPLVLHFFYHSLSHFTLPYVAAKNKPTASGATKQKTFVCATGSLTSATHNHSTRTHRHCISSSTALLNQYNNTTRTRSRQTHTHTNTQAHL